MVKQSDEIAELIRTRGQTYGSVEKVSRRYVTLHAHLTELPTWTSDSDIYCMSMLMVKFARLIGNPRDEDTIKDIMGYCHLMLYGDDPVSEADGVVHSDES